MRILWKLRQQRGMKMVLAYVTNVLVKINMFRTRCMHALLICQDHRVCELRKHFSFLFTPFFENFSAAQPFLPQQVNNQLVHDFLSQQNNRLFSFSFWAFGFICGWPKPVSSRSAKQPGWRLRTPYCNHWGQPTDLTWLHRAGFLSSPRVTI